MSQVLSMIVCNCGLQTFVGVLCHQLHVALLVCELPLISSSAPDVAYAIGFQSNYHI